MDVKTRFYDLAHESLTASDERKAEIAKELKDRFGVDTLPPGKGLVYTELALPQPDLEQWGWDVALRFGHRWMNASGVREHLKFTDEDVRSTS